MALAVTAGSLALALMLLGAARGFLLLVAFSFLGGLCAVGLVLAVRAG